MLTKLTKKIFLPIAFLLLAVFGFAGANDTIVERTFFDAKIFALSFITILAMAVFMWLFAPKINPPLARFSQFFKKVVIVCTSAFLAEMCLFNFVSLYKGDKVTEVPNEMILINDMPIDERKDIIYLDNADTITLIGKGSNVSCVELRFGGEDESFKIVAKIKDDNCKLDYSTVAAATASASNSYARLAIKPYGNLYSVELRLTDVNEILYFEGMSLLSAKPFYFNHTRMFLVMVVLLAIAAIKEFGLMRIKFDSRKITHQVALWSLATLCAFSVIYFKDFDAENIEYPLEYVENSDQYAQMYDSLEKDILHIDVKPHESLFEIENVYDISQREEAEAFYIWDRAFYNGKYYSYFGIAPTLTFWKPYMALCGELPSLNTAHMFAAFVSIFALFGTVLEFLKRYCPKVSAIMLFISLFCAVFISGIPIALFFGDGYNIAPAFGIMYLLLTLFFGFAATNSKNNILRCIMLFISGVCFALCVASRPTLAVGAVLLIFAFVSMLCSDIYSKKAKLAGAFSFALPIVAGLVMIGKYNAARFGSPFDFGMAYQLTVCDVSQKSLDISSMPAAVFHYFFAPPNLLVDFPFVDFRFLYFDNYGQDIYNEASVGVLNYLPIVLGVFLVAIVVRRKECALEKKCVYISGIAAMIFVAFSNFCLGGVNLRYTMDILPVLTLISVAVLLECYELCSTSKTLCSPCAVCCAIAFVQPIVLMILCALSVTYAPIIRQNPEIYYNIKDFIVFWR